MVCLMICVLVLCFVFKACGVSIICLVLWFQSCVVSIVCLFRIGFLVLCFSYRVLVLWLYYSVFYSRVFTTVQLFLRF